jgi:hypothetical protein
VRNSPASSPATPERCAFALIPEHTRVVISLGVARALREAGLRWSPGSGDRFVVADRAMDDDVFVVSEMTIEAHDVPDGRLLAFNGTTEWALDSVRHEDALWLPRESQLREMLGGLFRALERADGVWTVRVEVEGEQRAYTSSDAEDAYALAVLGVLDALR